MSDLFHQIVAQVTQLGVAALAGLLIALATQALRRIGLNLSAQQEAQIRYFAEKAVHVAEETIVHEGAGAEKLAAASSLVKKWLPGLDVAEIQDAIHAELARQRADAGNDLFQPRKP